MRLLTIMGSSITRLLLTIFITVSVVFFILRLLPGDPAEVLGGIGGTPDTIARTQERYGLQQPIGRQYGNYLGRIMILDFGESYFTNQSVVQLIAERLPLTLGLMFSSFLISLLVALPLSLLAALNPGILWSRIIAGMGKIALAIPEFWLGLLLALLFAVWIPILPLFGTESIFHFILPVATLALSRAAALIYLLREAIVKEQQKQYIIAARLWGISRWRLGIHWLLKNSLPAILPLATLQLGYLFGGAIIIEQLFALPGFGRLLIGALQVRDYPIIEGATACIALLFAIIGMAADLLHLVIDPRLRTKEQIQSLV